jgi:hypothetical protein
MAGEQFSPDMMTVPSSVDTDDYSERVHPVYRGKPSRAAASVTSIFLETLSGAQQFRQSNKSTRCQPNLSNCHDVGSNHEDYQRSALARKEKEVERL